MRQFFPKSFCPFFTCSYLLLRPVPFGFRFNVSFYRPVDLVDGCDAWDVFSGFETANRFDSDAS